MSVCDKAVFDEFNVICVSSNRQLNIYEALYKMKKGTLKVTDKDGNAIQWFDILKTLSTKEPNIWIKFEVYYDMRERGRILREGPHSSSFSLVVNEKPVAIVYVLEETVEFRVEQLLEWLEIANRLGRDAILAIVDKHGDVSYYILEMFS